ncbi:hypothetical protein [Polaribacter sp. R77954]|uniref:hypothetical protein n=1 Tax=Polaribacter sp. R77954 TaxID=3093870 RepID=UPI0037C9CF05
MKKIIFSFTIFFISITINPNNIEDFELNMPCEEYATNAARAEIKYYGGHHNWYNVYTSWYNDCMDPDIMNGDPSGWEDPIFCDLSCWPSYYD